jgi:hypothetical protein
LQHVFRGEQMRQLALVDDAMGAQTRPLLRVLDAACTSADDLADATELAFSQHPDAELQNTRRPMPAPPPSPEPAARP